MVKSVVPNHLFINYVLDFTEWILKDYYINTNQKSIIDEDLRKKIAGNIYDSDTAYKAFKKLVKDNQDRFLQESNTYSYYKLKYGTIKKIDKSIIESTIQHLKNNFENDNLH